MRLRLGWIGALLLAVLAACGGGGGGAGGSDPTPSAAQGALSLGLAGGAVSGHAHVWVTVTGVALNTDAGRAWSASDASWQVLRLATPVTIDLVAASNGQIAPLLAGRNLAPGTYAQLRLFVLRHDETLAESAKTLKLQWNAQVDSVDNSVHLPLEFADSALGLRADGPLTIVAGQSTDATLQWDLSRSLVRFAADDVADRVTVRPDLRIYDLARTGAIVGLMDKSLFCPGAAMFGCIADVVASAELPAADGSGYVSVRSTPVVVGDSYALFALYPLPALAANASFDVVIRGRNMRTMIVRAVPANAADLLAAKPTQLGLNPADPAHPIPMVPVLSAGGDAFVSLAQPANRSAAQIAFAQTLPGAGELPHEIAVANTDPFSGRFTQPQPLPTGALRVATYSSDSVLAFTDVQPQEGADSFSVATRATRYDQPTWSGLLTAPGGSSVGFVAPVVQRQAGIATATLSINLSGGSVSAFDAAELVVSDIGGIVTTLDVAAQIGKPSTVDLQLPAGANAAALGGTAVYSVAVRAWKRSAPAKAQWARAAPVDMRSGSAATVLLALP
jgi:hypothetical protein